MAVSHFVRILSAAALYCSPSLVIPYSTVGVELVLITWVLLYSISPSADSAYSRYFVRASPYSIVVRTVVAELLSAA